jgi:class 3 adenylate cyclase
LIRTRSRSCFEDDRLIIRGDKREEREAVGGQLEFRIGNHQGDIIIEESDIFGDGVYIAARLKALAEPRGICVSARVHEDVARKIDLASRISASRA